MRRIFCATVFLWLAVTGGALAQERLVVVELYTSQGCSSCPPADAMLGELVEDVDVLPLALHVDYWDYIGWKDEFGSPSNTHRQKRYAHAAGNRSIYTPQFIVGGKDHVVGHRPTELLKLIGAHGKADYPVQLELQRDGDRVRVTAAAVQNDSGGDMVLQIVRYIPSQAVSIGRGENAGRTLTYHNIVTSWKPVMDWSGRKPLSVEVEADGDLPVAAILQYKGFGPVVAAARLR